MSEILLFNNYDSQAWLATIVSHDSCCLAMLTRYIKLVVTDVNDVMLLNDQNYWKLNPKTGFGF